MRALLQRLMAWLRTAPPCEDCGEPEATFRPNHEAFLCDRCAGVVK